MGFPRRLNAVWGGWWGVENQSAIEGRRCIPTTLRRVRAPPSPHTDCLNLDSLRLKMATWSAVLSNTELLQPARSSNRALTSAAPSPWEMMPDCHKIVKPSFRWSWRIQCLSDAHFSKLFYWYTFSESDPLSWSHIKSYFDQLQLAFALPINFLIGKSSWH